MNPSFEQIFEQLENQRSITLDSIRHLTDAQLTKAPFRGKWSLAQIFSHLITAERLSLAYVQKKMLGIQDISDSGFLEEVKIIVLKISQRLPGIRFRAPKRVVENTAVYQDFGTIQREWDAVRNDWRAALEKIKSDQVRKLVYRHPLAGYLNIGQCLIFFREHIIHHTPQIKRLINQK